LGITRLYHCGGKSPRGSLATVVLLLQDLFSPPFNNGLVFHLLPPVGSFSDVIGERTHPQLNDLVERCRNLAAVLEEFALTVLGGSIVCHRIRRQRSPISRKGWSNPASGSCTAWVRSGSLRLPSRFIRVVVVLVIKPRSILTGTAFPLAAVSLLLSIVTPRKGDRR